MFKIRTISNSAPKLTQFCRQKNQQPNRYKCLQEISDTENYWKSLLQNQLQMASTIVAFQNVQISMRVDAHKKLMLRETFVLKKQIIKLIINEKYQQILTKLDILKNKSPADCGLVTLFIEFFNIRKNILQRNLQYSKETIKQIKRKIIQSNQKIQKQKNSILYGRIVYIAALHLVKLDGVLVKNQEKNIIVQALNLKKKQLCIVSSQISQPTLQSLLFLTFQFYKILYLLKRDQDLMMQYYNQIRAYISIYKSKCRGFNEFQNNFKILQKIEKMKPLSLNLKIYDDHDRRRVLSLQNTEQQLLKNHYALRNANILSTQISAQIKNKKTLTVSRHNCVQSSFQKTQNSENILNSNSINITKSKIENLSQNEDQCSEKLKKKTQNTSQKTEGISIPLLQQSQNQKRFCFQFIKPDKQCLLIGKFQAAINLSLSTFVITIKLFESEQIAGIYKLQSKLQLDKVKSQSTALLTGINLSDYAKRLWRVIKQQFYTDKTEFIPNLFSFQYPPTANIPNKININYELPILVRVHQILLHYLRKYNKIKKPNGWTIQFPKQKNQVLQSISTVQKHNQAEKDKQIRQKQIRKDQQQQLEQKIFAKRHGFISFNRKVKTMRSILSINRNFIQNSNNSHYHIPEETQSLKLSFLIKQQSWYASIYIQIQHSSFKQLKLTQLYPSAYKKNKKISHVNRNRLTDPQHMQRQGSQPINQRKIALWKDFITVLINKSPNYYYRRKIQYFICCFYHQLFSEQLFFPLDQPQAVTQNGSVYQNDYHQFNRYIDKSIQEQFEVMKSPVLQTKKNSIKNYRYGKKITQEAKQRFQVTWKANNTKVRKLLSINQSLDNIPQKRCSYVVKNQDSSININNKQPSRWRESSRNYSKIIKINNNYRILRQKICKNRVNDNNDHEWEPCTKYLDQDTLNQFVQSHTHAQLINNLPIYSSNHANSNQKYYQIVYNKFRLYKVYVMREAGRPQHKKQATTYDVKILHNQQLGDRVRDPGHKMFGRQNHEQKLLGQHQNWSFINQNACRRGETNYENKCNRNRYLKLTYSRNYQQPLPKLRLIKKQQIIDVQWLKTFIFRSKAKSQQSSKYYLLNMFALISNSHQQNKTSQNINIIPVLIVNLFSVKDSKYYMGKITILNPELRAYMHQCIYNSHDYKSDRIQSMKVVWRLQQDKLQLILKKIDSREECKKDLGQSNQYRDYEQQCLLEDDSLAIRIQIPLKQHSTNRQSISDVQDFLDSYCYTSNQSEQM